MWPISNKIDVMVLLVFIRNAIILRMIYSTEFSLDHMLVQCACNQVNVQKKIIKSMLVNRL